MRDYGKVHTSFWTSSTIRALSEDGRYLAIYLLTSPHSNIAGTFRLPDGYVCEDLGWSSQRVSKGFAELFRNGFATRCEATKWVWVIKHLEWNPPENPNQRKSAAKIVGTVPSECAWKLDFMRVSGPSLGIDGVDNANPSATVSKGFPKPFANQEQEQEQDKEPLLGKKPNDTDPDSVAGIIDYLNERAGKRFEAVEANAKFVRARLAEFDAATIRAVVDAKVSEWRDDAEMARYLRPATLFNAEKFAQYAGELQPRQGGGGKWWLGLGFGTLEMALAEGATQADARVTA